jgi:hypothetical protein
MLSHDFWQVIVGREATANGSEIRRLILGTHKCPHQGSNLVCLGVEREVARVEHVNLRLRHVLAIAFGLSRMQPRLETG